MTDTAQAGAPALPIPSGHDCSFIPYSMGLILTFEKCLPDTRGRLFHRCR
jgi:hypothetical protein